jgi:hypothetical protein
MDLPMSGATVVAAADAVRWRRGAALLFVVAVLSWAELGWRLGVDLAAGRHVHLAVTAALMAVAHLAGNGLEASAYVLWWRAHGARLPWGWFFVALVALSLVDRCAVALADAARRAPALASWLAPLVGPELLRARVFRVEPGAWAAFGGLGLLALARIGATACLQAALTGRRVREALAVTMLAWLGTRVALWWIVDLVRGRSPLP